MAAVCAGAPATPARAPQADGMQAKDRLYREEREETEAGSRMTRINQANEVLQVGGICVRPGCMRMVRSAAG